MIALALLAALAQDPAPRLELTVDRDRVTVGEEVTVTVRATSRSLEPLRVSVATPDGFDEVGREERSEVALATPPLRITNLVITLVAREAGEWTVGPVVGEQGRLAVEAPARTLQVLPAARSVEARLAGRLAGLMQRAPRPPEPGEPALTVALSSDTARPGDQVDVLTIAWFPRTLRSTLRRPPALKAPALEGVWTVGPPEPLGGMLRETVRGVPYDLFVTHQTVFPITAGTVRVPPGTLTFLVPSTQPFPRFEERRVLESAPATLHVAALPADGRPADFAGAAGTGLALRVVPPSGTLRRGTGSVVEVQVEGTGNAALWPAPRIAWPRGLRAYEDRAVDQLMLREGRVGGRKRFRYTVVPDSAGRLPPVPVVFAYFDLAANEYRTLRGALPPLVVEGGGGASVGRPSPPPLLRSAGPSALARLGDAVPAWAWPGIFGLPLVLLLARRLPRPSRRAVTAVAAARGTDAELGATLESLVPGFAALGPGERRRALAALGLPAATVDRALAYLGARQRADFGPPATRPVATATEADVLARELRRWRRGAAAVVLLAGAAGVAGPLAAQSGELLFRRGQVESAADSFAARVRRRPADAAQWYNLGAARYALGDDGDAVAAWVRALRLAPRAEAPRRALELLPAPDRFSERVRWVPPAAPGELLVLGAAAWSAGWVLVAVRRRRRGRLLLAVGAALALGGGALAWQWREPVRIVRHATPLRVAPGARAEAVVTLPAGTAVRPRRELPGWVLAEHPSRGLGWLPAEEVTDVAD